MTLPSPTIHRSTLTITDEQEIWLRRGAVLLHLAAGYFGAGTANPMVELWYHCDLDEPLVSRRFRIVGTGHLADVDPARHVGSVIHEFPGGRGVWHVFDLGDVVDVPPCAGCSSPLCEDCRRPS